MVLLMVCAVVSSVCTIGTTALPHQYVRDASIGAADSESCGTAADCSYAGVCADGKCECDQAWTGARCDILDLRPAKPNGGFNAAVGYGQCEDVRNCSS